MCSVFFSSLSFCISSITTAIFCVDKSISCCKLSLNLSEYLKNFLLSKQDEAKFKNKPNKYINTNITNDGVKTPLLHQSPDQQTMNQSGSCFDLERGENDFYMKMNNLPACTSPTYIHYKQQRESNPEHHEKYAHDPNYRQAYNEADLRNRNFYNELDTIQNNIEDKYRHVHNNPILSETDPIYDEIESLEEKKQNMENQSPILSPKLHFMDTLL
jgi:hypothetical protein